MNTRAVTELGERARVARLTREQALEGILDELLARGGERGDVRLAAQAAGVSPSTIYRRIRRRRADTLAQLARAAADDLQEPTSPPRTRTAP